MSKKIVVPYTYTSSYFGLSRHYPKLTIIVDEPMTAERFHPDYVPHRVTLPTLIKLERDCAKRWLRAVVREPRRISAREAVGLLTVINQDVVEFTDAAGGDRKSIADAINMQEDLSDEDSAVFLTALSEHFNIGQP